MESVLWQTNSIEKQFGDTYLKQNKALVIDPSRPLYELGRVVLRVGRLADSPIVTDEERDLSGQ